MRRLVSFIFLFYFLILNSHFAFSDENLKLVFALDLVRHGDRNPQKYIPKVSNVWTKDEVGEITPLGKKQAKILGEKFRNYYVNKMNLLPKEFQLNLIRVNSTGKQRTDETARSILEGMFPANWTKVSIIKRYIVTLQSLKEQVLVFNKLSKDGVLAEQWFMPSIKQQLKYINKIFGTEFSTAVEFRHVADIIRVSKIYNKPLLKKIPEQTQNKIISLAGKHKLKFLTYPKITCIYGKDFIGFVENTVQSQYKQKYFLYAGHDTNIVTIVSLLGDDLKHRLPYLSDLRFEVFQDLDNKKLFVKTSLDGRVIKVCKSSNDCPLKEFIATLKSNVKNKCEVST